MDELPDDRPDDDYPDNDDEEDVPYRPMDGSNIPGWYLIFNPYENIIGDIGKCLKVLIRPLMIEQLYKELDVEGDVNLIDRDRFKVTKDTKNKSYNVVLFAKNNEAWEKFNKTKRWKVQSCKGDPKNYG